MGKSNPILVLNIKGPQTSLLYLPQLKNIYGCKKIRLIYLTNDHLGPQLD